MKAELFFLLAFPLASAWGNSITCMNADGSFNYYHETSNGGAPLEITTLTYQGMSIGLDSPGNNSVGIEFTKKKVLETVKTEGHTRVTFSTRAVGEFTYQDKRVTFSEWAVCREDLHPICELCP